nr:MAG: nonstructural protein [Pigeon-associated parvo-like virus]
MLHGAFARQKKQCSKIVCFYTNSNTKLNLPIILLDHANAAVNAVIAQEAAAARQAMAAQALAECRQQNNPYLPGNSGILGPNRAQMYGPDPCESQKEALAEASQALAQINAPPTAAAPQAAAAPQLSETDDMQIELLNPAIPETEGIVPDPALSNMWSPQSIEDTMMRIAEELEKQGQIGDQEMEQLDEIASNMTYLLSYWCWEKPKRQRKRYQFLPKNQGWLGKWAPP